MCLHPAGHFFAATRVCLRENIEDISLLLDSEDDELSIVWVRAVESNMHIRMEVMLMLVFFFIIGALLFLLVNYK